MPLYKIPPRANRPLGFHALDYTEQEIKEINRKIRTDYINQVRFRETLPAIYLSMSVFIILSDSSNFTLYNIQKPTGYQLGSYQGASVYLSEILSKDEYFIGIEEGEILQYKRIHKLNKIIKRMNHVL